ncbi:MAG: hypothetical protein V4607_13460 [Pseudomonadota bacterium]
MIRLLAGSVIAIATLAGISACSRSSSPEATDNGGLVSLAATPQAKCGRGSRPETGMQGRVSQADQDNGLAALGFTCNTELVGSHTTPNAIGSVGGFKVVRYVDAAGHDCAYYDTTFIYPANILDETSGVNVLDMSDPKNPVLVKSLNTPAMLSPHESLVVNEKRGVLAAVLGNPAFGPGLVDLYDISQDCRNPVWKSTTLTGVLGHESGMSPDGNTFYSASPGTPTLTAIDISDLSNPKILAILPYATHGLTISADGNRAYLAAVGIPGAACAYALSCDVPDPNHDRGLIILDVSEIQARKPNPQVREVSRLNWPAMSIPQNAIPFTRNGRPYLLEIDEFARGGFPATGLPGPVGNVGAARIIDIGDEKTPKVISNLRLEVHNPENFAAIANDPGASFIGQGYAGHYCNVSSAVNPTIAACTMILSGLRIFDIRDVHHPKEIAYFNAPQYPRITPVLVQSNFAMAQPTFVPERKEIWYTDAYSGFYAVRVTNGMW